ncbi:MAG: hypothetical protein ACR2NH_00975, partial [Solirubrobacteraceae bacterium]
AWSSDPDHCPQGRFSGVGATPRDHAAARETAGGLALGVSGGAQLPEHVEVVDGDAWIGERCEIGEGVRLMGRVVIGDGARVGAGCSVGGGRSWMRRLVAAVAALTAVLLCAPAAIAAPGTSTRRSRVGGLHR